MRLTHIHTQDDINPLPHIHSDVSWGENYLRLITWRETFHIRVRTHIQSKSSLHARDKRKDGSNVDHFKLSSIQQHLRWIRIEGGRERERQNEDPINAHTFSQKPLICRTMCECVYISLSLLSSSFEKKSVHCSSCCRHYSHTSSFASSKLGRDVKKSN